MTSTGVDDYAVFSTFYDAWTTKMPDDIPFYTSLAQGVHGPVIELAAGTGRVAVPMAAAGVDVIAVDASPEMIARGRARAEREGVGERLRWIEASMQGFVSEEPVELIIIPARSFLHLMTIEDQLQALSNIRRSLVSGGRFALNFFVVDFRVQAENDSKRTLQVEFTDEEGRRCEVWSVPSYEPATQLLTVHATCDRYRGGRLEHTDETRFQLRFVHRFEFEHLLARSGFEVDALYGWFDGRPFTEDCREMIWVARKP